MSESAMLEMEGEMDIEELKRLYGRGPNGILLELIAANYAVGAQPPAPTRTASLKDLLHEEEHDKHDEEFPVHGQEEESDEDFSQDEAELVKNRKKEEEELKEAAEVPIETLVEDWKTMVQKDAASEKVRTIRTPTKDYAERKGKRKGKGKTPRATRERRFDADSCRCCFDASANRLHPQYYSCKN